MSNNQLELPTVATILAARRNFEEDIKPLVFLLTHHQTLATQELGIILHSKTFVEEDKIRALAGRTATTVTEGLTPEYLSILHMYFLPEALTDYITSFITLPLIKLATRINQEVISGSKGNKESNENVAVDSGIIVQAKDM